MTFFTDVVDTFYNYLEVGKVYDFCNFKIGFARKPFNTLNNEYELQCIRTCMDRRGSLMSSVDLHLAGRQRDSESELQLRSDQQDRDDGAAQQRGHSRDRRGLDAVWM